MNAMEIQGYKAIIKYDPEIDMFRGEFTSLNGGGGFLCDQYCRTPKRRGNFFKGLFRNVSRRRN